MLKNTYWYELVWNNGLPVYIIIVIFKWIRSIKKDSFQKLKGILLKL